MAQTQIHNQSRTQLSWSLIFGASVVAGIVVGLLVYLFVPLKWSAEASILSNTGSGGNASLIDMAAQAAGADSSSSSLSVTRLQAIIESRRIRKEVASQAGVAQRLGMSEKRATGALKSMTSFRAAPGGNLILTVTCSGISRVGGWRGASQFSNDVARELCADVANAYIEALRGYLQGQTRSQIKFMRARKTELTASLDRTDDELESFASRNGILGATSQADILTSQMKAATEAQAQAQADQAAAEKTLDAARRSLSQQELMRIQAETTTRNPVIASLSQSLADNKVALDEILASGMKAGHPDVIALKEKIRATESQLRGLTADIRTQVSREVNPAHDTALGQMVNGQIALAQSAARVASYGARLEAGRRQIAALPPLVRRYNQLVLQHDTQAEMLKTLTNKLELAIIEEKREASDKFQVLDVAEPPLEKSGPSTARSAAAAMMIVLFSLGFAALRQRGLLGMPVDPEYSEPSLAPTERKAQ